VLIVAGREAASKGFVGGLEQRSGVKRSRSKSRIKIRKRIRNKIKSKRRTRTAPSSYS
jgi:hypothetical protein